MWKAIKIICLIFLVICLGGCAAAMISLGKAVDTADKTGARASANINQVHFGMSKDEVISILGKPDDNGQHSESSFMGDTTTEDCIYYGTLSTNDSWQLCFTDGQLDSKNRW